MRSRLALAAVTAALITGLAAAPASADPRMRLLPLPADATGGYAVDITTTGVVYGHVFVASGLSRAVSWVGGRLVPLEVDDGGFSEVVQANDLGMAVGHHHQAADYAKHAVVWFAGRRIDLNPAGAQRSEVVGTNNRGQVLFIGYEDSGEGGSTATLRLWEAGRSRVLATSVGFAIVAALGEGGHVAASVFQDPAVGRQTLVWRGSDPVREIPRQGFGSIPRAVGPRGDVVISVGSLTASVNQLWRDGVQTATIAELPGHPLVNVGQLYAGAPGGPYVNGSGEVVGSATSAGGSTTRALRWSGGASTDLSPDTTDRARAYSINERGTATVSQCPDAGQIGCTSTLVARDGTRTALTPPVAGSRVLPWTLHPYLPWVVGAVADENGIRPFLWR